MRTIYFIVCQLFTAHNCSQPLKRDHATEFSIETADTAPAKGTETFSQDTHLFELLWTIFGQGPAAVATTPATRNIAAIMQ